MYVDQHGHDVISVLRKNPYTHRTFIMVTRSAFHQGDVDASLKAEKELRKLPAGGCPF